MTRPALKVQGLGKEYVIGHACQRRGETFYELLSQRLHHPLRSLFGPSGQTQERFWALQDVSFEVQPGEVVGVIGRNGAGKSTLLKILSRITAPSTGRVEVRGRLASLLEVGTGFHPELTGQENIYLNGAILGMTRREVARKFDEIVAFAEIEKFIDTPVKRYSSGMYVRLAFAVAANLDADVLVVDEVLAVGDAEFQKKCLGKMQEISGGGRTVLFVSHNMAAVARLCSRTLVMTTGRLVFDGDPSAGISHYSVTARQSAQGLTATFLGPLVGKVTVERLHLNEAEALHAQTFKPDQPIVLSVTARLHELLRSFRMTVCLFKGEQQVLGMHDLAHPEDAAAGLLESRFTLPAYFLSPGEYTLDINLYSEANHEWMIARGAASFTVATAWYPHYEPTHGMGLVNLPRLGCRQSGG